MRRSASALVLGLVLMACSTPEGAMLTQSTEQVERPPARPPVPTPAIAPSAPPRAPAPPMPAPAPVTIDPAPEVPIASGLGPPAVTWSGLRVLFFVFGAEPGSPWVAVPISCADGSTWLPARSCLDRLPSHPRLVLEDGREVRAGDRTTQETYAYAGLAVVPEGRRTSLAAYASEGAPVGVRGVACGLEERRDGHAPAPLAPRAADALASVPTACAPLSRELEEGRTELAAALRGDFDGDGAWDRLARLQLGSAFFDSSFVVLERGGATRVLEVFDERSPADPDPCTLDEGPLLLEDSDCLDFDADGAVEVFAAYRADTQRSYEHLVLVTGRAEHVGRIGLGD